MKILFYLPAVTPWWFDAIVAPMLRRLHDAPGVELHVMAAKLWRHTGITPENFMGVGDLDRVQWHIVASEEPARFRRAGAEVAGLLDKVAEIDPDLTLARSADLAIGQFFPGTVRYVMEGAAPPFATDPRWIAFEDQPFAHGAMPADQAALAEACAASIAPAWDLAERRIAWATREKFGLPEDRPVIAVPLQFEHAENQFLAHAAWPRAAELIEHLLATLSDDVMLAFSDHPLNRMHGADPAHPLHVDRTGLDALVAAHPDRARLYPVFGASDMLAALADAMLVDLSKTWLLAAFCGTPMVNMGTRVPADWLHALSGLAALPARPARPGLAGPDRAEARRWFGWHFGGRVVAPDRLDLDRLLRCVASRPSEEDAMTNCEMLLAAQKEPA